MSEITRFLGIIITMHYGDHPPPHFHARYGEYKAIVSIRPLAIIEGRLPPRVQGLVIEWAAMCQDELLENWGERNGAYLCGRLHHWSKAMLKDVIEVRPLENYQLYLRFEDGVSGEVDVSELMEFTGVFEPLQDKNFFDQVRVNPDLGTICWPNDADLDPVVLYSQVTGEPLPDFSTLIPLTS